MTEQAKYILTGFWNKYGALPKTEDLARKFEISHQEAEEWKTQFKGSVSEGQTSGGQRSTSTANSGQHQRQSVRRSSKPSISEKETSPLPTLEKAEKLESKPSHFDWHSLLTVGLIKALWSIFALLCAYRSFDYVFSWFSRMDSVLNAVVAAILCTGATFLIPSSIVMGRLGKVAGSGLASLFLVFMFVTVNSTVGSLYETRRALESGSEKTAVSQDQNKARMDQLNDMIKQSRLDSASLASELSQRLRVQETYEVGAREYDRLAGNISTIKTRQDRNNALLAGYQDELGKLTATTVSIKPRASYSSWWDQLLGLAPGSWDLFFGMAFAIALDIVGPVALLISFYLGGRREDKN